MELTKVVASRRTESGKGRARRLRGRGEIPAVAYGRGEPVLSLAVAPKALSDILSGKLGRNTVFELDVDQKECFPVLLADLQHHPVSRDLIHADFLRIALDAPVDVEIPVATIGKSPGVVMGGVVRIVFRRLPVRCLPKDIPVNITIDISGLELDDHVAASQVVVPEGVTLRVPPNQTVLAIVTETSGKGEEEEATAKEGAATAEGAAAAGAPAAGDKPAVAGDKPAAGANKPAVGAKTK